MAHKHKDEPPRNRHDSACRRVRLPGIAGAGQDDQLHALLQSAAPRHRLLVGHHRLPLLQDLPKRKEAAETVPLRGRGSASGCVRPVSDNVPADKMLHAVLARNAIDSGETDGG